MAKITLNIHRVTKITHCGTHSTENGSVHWLNIDFDDEHGKGNEITFFARDREHAQELLRQLVWPYASNDRIPFDFEVFLSEVENFLESLYDVNYEGTGPNKAGKLYNELRELRRKFAFA